MCTAVPATSGSNKRRIGCVVMAAGQAVRFGSDKLMADWLGQPLYAHTLSVLPKEILAHIVVVSRSEEILQAAAECGYEPVLNEHPEAGPGRTVRLGLGHMPAVDAVLFCVCDQPELQRHSLEKLVCTYAGGIRAASFDGRRGNPVIFPAALLPELRMLKDHQGGSTVIRRHGQLLTICETGCCRELLDVDTPADLAALRDLDYLLLDGPGSETMLAEAGSLLSGAGIPAAAAGSMDPQEVEQLTRSPRTLLLWSGDCSAAEVAGRLAPQIQTFLPARGLQAVQTMDK